MSSDVYLRNVIIAAGCRVKNELEETGKEASEVAKAEQRDLEEIVSSQPPFLLSSCTT